MKTRIITPAELADLQSYLAKCDKEEIRDEDGEIVAEAYTDPDFAIHLDIDPDNLPEGVTIVKS
jgi:hypothetical protein